MLVLIQYYSCNILTPLISAIMELDMTSYLKMTQINSGTTYRNNDPELLMVYHLFLNDPDITADQSLSRFMRFWY